MAVTTCPSEFPSLISRIEHLRRLLAEVDSGLIAFSGGVDSAFLLRVAAEVLGTKCFALTTVSPTTPEHDLDTARALAAAFGVTHLIVETDELAIAGYAANPPDRCYLCKHNLYSICLAEARRRGLAAVFDGANVDDLRDYRPGLSAATEQGVRHPLVEAGFSKADVRAASRALGLPTWDRPASPCLSSRFPYGTRITRERLAQVAAAERALRAEGIPELRVRWHEGGIARIEVRPADMPRVLARREAILAAVQAAGFARVTLDLAGFRSGSLNEDITRQEHDGPADSPPARRLR